MGMYVTPVDSSTSSRSRPNASASSGSDLLCSTCLPPQNSRFEAGAVPRRHDMKHLNTVTGLGVRLVLVLGARPNIDAMVRQSGAEPQYAAGQRVTDARTMQAAMQAAGAARMQVEGRLSKVQPEFNRVRFEGSDYV